jgi:hypothetical protein
MLRGVTAGDSVMLGQQRGDQSQLFYLFNLEERIPARYLLRRINLIVTRVVADLREKLKPFLAIGRVLSRASPFISMPKWCCCR